MIYRIKKPFIGQRIHLYLWYTSVKQRTCSYRIGQMNDRKKGYFTICCSGTKYVYLEL